MILEQKIREKRIEDPRAFLKKEKKELIFKQI